MVSSLIPESADFVSDILCEMYSEADIIEFGAQFHDGNVEKLLGAMLKARHKWAEVLRDCRMVDVRIIILPARQIDVFHHDEDKKFPCGTQEGRFTELKDRLVREVSTSPPDLKPGW
jgi:hypothetical protein